MNQPLEGLVPFSSSYRDPWVLSSSVRLTFANVQTSQWSETDPTGAWLAAARRPL